MADLKETYFRWILTNFDMCTETPGKHIKSPEFSIDTSKSTKLHIKLYPRGDANADSTHTSACLSRRLDCGPEMINLKIEMHFLNDQGDITSGGKTSEDYEFSKAKGWGLSKFYDRNSLKLKNQGSRTKNLTVECRVLPLPPTHECSNNNEEHEVYSEEIGDILSSDIAKIFQSGLHSDMTLIVHDQKFPLHKAILECRCPKLLSQPQNTFQNIYTLPDIEVIDIPQLLHYLYTGILNAGCVNTGIFTASRTYGLPDLCNALPYPFSMLAITDVNVTRWFFEWGIRNISKLKENEDLVYNLFYDEDLKQKLQVVLNVRHGENATPAFLLKFRKVRESKISFIRCKVAIVKQSYVPNIVREFENRFETGEEWSKCLSSNGVISNIDILRKNSLNFSFEISVSNGEYSSKIEEVIYEAKTEEVGAVGFKSLKLFQNDLRNLHDNRKFSDVTVCVGDEKLPAHKAILCARSKVFARMFEHEMSEYKAGVIVIEDIDLATVSSMLLYIYCGCINIMNISDAINLYAAADKYELLTLKEKCSAFLKSNLNSDDIDEILLLADAHHDEALRICANDFITSNAEDIVTFQKLHCYIS